MKAKDIIFEAELYADGGLVPFHEDDAEGFRIECYINRHNLALEQWWNEIGQDKFLKWLEAEEQELEGGGHG